MKKTLSIILSLVFTLSAFMPLSVYAQTKDKVKEYKVGDTFSVSVEPIDYDAEYKAGKEPYYYAKFKPTKSGYYEFVFDTKFTVKLEKGVDAEIGILSATLLDKTGENFAGFGMAAASAGDGAVEPEDGSDDVSFSAEVKAGETYYLMISNMSSKTYKSKVTINKHTHHYVDQINASTVDSKDLKNNEAGFHYTGCDNHTCMYTKINKTIRKVKSITLSKTVYTYNGNEKKPKVTVTDSKGNVVDSKNYKIKYSNNKNVGTAKVKITFRNEYEGTYVAEYKINPKGTSVKSLTANKKGFTVKLNKQATQTTGYQVQYATDSKFTKNKKTVTVKGAKNTSKAIKNLKAKKKYYVRVRTYKVVDGKNYYSAWSKAKTVTTKK